MGISKFHQWKLGYVSILKNNDSTYIWLLWSANILVSASKMGIRSKFLWRLGCNRLKDLGIWSLKPEIWTDNSDSIVLISQSMFHFLDDILPTRKGDMLHQWMDGSRFCIPFFGVSNNSSHHPILCSNGQVFFASTIIPSNVSFPQQLAEITSSTRLGTRKKTNPNANWCNPYPLTVTLEYPGWPLPCLVDNHSSSVSSGGFLKWNPQIIHFHRIVHYKLYKPFFLRIPHFRTPPHDLGRSVVWLCPNMGYTKSIHVLIISFVSSNRMLFFMEPMFCKTQVSTVLTFKYKSDMYTLDTLELERNWLLVSFTWLEGLYLQSV